MKKILLCVLAILLITFPLSINAFDVTSEKPEINGDIIFDVLSCEGAGYVGDTIFNWDGGVSFCVKFDTYVYYLFNAPVDNTYTILIEFIGRVGNNRGFDIEIDNTGRQFFDIPESNDPQWFVNEVEIKKGAHELRIWAPTNMDDSELKSVDVYKVALYSMPVPEPVPEIIKDTPAEIPGAEIPTADVNNDTPITAPVTSPQTGNTFAGSMFLIIASAAVITVAKTKKKKA